MWQQDGNAALLHCRPAARRERGKAYENTACTPKERAKDLLQELSLDEKIAQARDMWDFPEEMANKNPEAKAAYEKAYEYGIGQVSTLFEREMTSTEECTAFQRDLQKKIMEKSLTASMLPSTWRAAAAPSSRTPPTIQRASEEVPPLILRWREMRQVARLPKEQFAGFLDGNRPCAGHVGDRVFLQYFAHNCPCITTFFLPEGGTYEIRVIDTWEMTEQTVRKDAAGQTPVLLPGKEGILAVAFRKDS